jgi:hypothetical protein
LNSLAETAKNQVLKEQSSVRAQPLRQLLPLLATPAPAGQFSFRGGRVVPRINFLLAKSVKKIIKCGFLNGYMNFLKRFIRPLQKKINSSKKLYVHL